MEDRILESVAKIIGAEMGREEGGEQRNKGAEEETWTELRRTLRAETGHRVRKEGRGFGLLGVYGNPASL